MWDETTLQWEGIWKEKGMERGMREREEEGAAIGVAGVVHIMENSAPVTGVQNGSPHL